ncbi:hypothetical protein LCGC14_0719070 [marine sediment metagenome]|uniref:Uncharacterized protein n=1 Tax=marine sediment metagenome TaxID=412755 RepID=A0A0F9QY12_9ZZZZ
MTPEQYERWKDFSLRAAKTWYATSRRPSAAWVLETVEEFFDRLDESDVPLIRHWDHNDNYPDRLDRHGREDRPLCIGDQLTEFLWEWEPYHAVVDDDDYEIRDERERRAHEQWEEQWGGPVHCCIRAGLDMACAPSGGVVGFTAGDIRAMYPEGVPEWLFPSDEKLVYALSGGASSGTFSELPDDAPLWL